MGGCTVGVQQAALGGEHHDFRVYLGARQRPPSTPAPRICASSGTLTPTQAALGKGLPDPGMGGGRWALQLQVAEAGSSVPCPPRWAPGPSSLDARPRSAGGQRGPCERPASGKEDAQTLS